MSDACVIVEACSFTYQAGAKALDDVSFKLASGELLCLAGANGSGKSTLLALLAGLLRPGAGRVAVAGVSNPPHPRALRAVSRLLLQDPDMQILGSTVEEDLLLTIRADERAAEARVLAERLGLGAVLDAPVHTLSYGQKRKLCLATALLPVWGQAPIALLLDEPCSGLDYPALLELRELLRQNSAQGLTQIVSTHDLDPVIDLADRLAVLEQGRLALFGRPVDMLDRVREHGVRPPGLWQAGLGLRSWE